VRAAASLIALLVVAPLAPGVWPSETAVSTVDAGIDADVGHDRIVRRTSVPPDGRRHGEVRIVRRDENVVVQTVLHSKVLRRVAGEIARKEASAWPGSVPGSTDSERFVAALREIVDHVRLEDTEEADVAGDRHRDLRIDFFIREGRGRVVLSGAEVVEEGTTLRLVASRPPAESLDLSADYVGRNMRLIVADSFRTSVEEADRMLATSE
jgi:hypothetical protein